MNQTLLLIGSASICWFSPFSSFRSEAGSLHFGVGEEGSRSSPMTGRWSSSRGAYLISFA